MVTITLACYTYKAVFALLDTPILYIAVYAIQHGLGIELRKEQVAAEGAAQQPKQQPLQATCAVAKRAIEHTAFYKYA